MVDLVQKIILESDVGNAEKELSRITKEQARLSKEIEDSAKSSGIASKATQDLLDQYKNTIKAEKALQDSIKQTNDEYGERRKLIKADDDLSRTNQDLSTVGQSESSLRTLGGTFGAFGGTEAERAISLIAEAPAATEALSQLATTLPSLGNAAIQAAENISPVGLAMTALAVAGVALITEVTRAQVEAAEKLGIYIDSYRELNQELASGSLTTEEATQRLEQAKKARDAESELLKTLQDDYDVLVSGQKDFGLAIKLTSATEEELANQIGKSRKQTEEYESSIKLLEEALENGTLSATDAAEAERNLAQERLNALFSEAALAGELEELRIRSQDLTREQIESELETIDRRRQAIEAELEVLEQSGDTSEEVAKKIEELNAQLENLGAKSKVLESAEGANSSEAELKTERDASTEATKRASEATKEKADAEREAERATKAAEKAIADNARIQRQYAETVAAAGVNFSNSIEDIKQNTKDSSLDNQLETQRDLADLQRDTRLDEIDAEREHAKNLKTVKDEARRAEKGALRQRDFLALNDERDAAKVARKEAEEEFEEEGNERLIEAQRQRDEITLEAERMTADLMRESSRQARDARTSFDRQIAAAKVKLSNEAKALDQSLKLTQAWGVEFNKIIGSALNNTTGGNGTTGNINNAVDSRFNQLVSPTTFGAV